MNYREAVYFGANLLHKQILHLMLNFKEFMADAHVGEQKYLGIHRKRETDPKGTLHVEIQPSKDQKHSDYVK